MDNYNELNIKNEEDFQMLMDNLEKELKNDAIPIRNRPMHAWDRISSKHTFGLPFPKSGEEPIPNLYSGGNLSLLIFRWFEKKYGERLKTDFCWKIAVSIRGDIYKVKLPLIMGTRGVKVFNLIEGFTQEYASLLTKTEITELINAVQLGYRARNSIEGKFENLLINQAIGDIEASVTHLTTQLPQYGLSKWSSLQATEKTLKAFIEEKTGNFPFTHKLQELKTLAESNGSNLISNILIDTVQCDAGVRYGNPSVTLNEAIQAHHACLEVCSEIAKQITL